MNEQAPIIERGGKPEYAVLPIDEYRRLLDLAEDHEDIAASDRAVEELRSDQDELIPADVADALLADENPVKVWRTHRGLTQEALAQAVGVTKQFIHQLEHDKSRPKVDTLVKLAHALRVDLDDLTV